jgi:L-lactate dehydrogenase complex protein LldG
MVAQAPETSMSAPSDARDRDYAAIPRQYRQSGALDLEALLALFADRLRDYGAAVYRSAESAVPATIDAALAARNKKRLLVPDSIPRAWLPEPFDWIADRDLNYHDIEHCDGVLTTCTVAIASTGTIVLAHSPSAGRRALSLLPDYHLCLVRAVQIVETLPQAMRALTPYAASPITTISGPSATADIEMTRIQGVHGPRILDVILLVPTAPPPAA